MKQPYQLDVAILLLLVALPTNPYDLVRPLATFGYVWSKPGTVSLRLKQLAQEGLVVGTWETAGSDRPRLIYTVTEAGLAYLQWVAMPR